MAEEEQEQEQFPEPVVHTSPYPPPEELVGIRQCNGKYMKPVSHFDWQAYRENFASTMNDDPMLCNLMNEFNLVRERYWTDENTQLQQNNILQQSVANAKRHLQYNIDHVYNLLKHYEGKFNKMRDAVKNSNPEITPQQGDEEEAGTIFCDEYTKRFQMNIWNFMFDLRRTWLLLRQSQSTLFYMKHAFAFTDDAIEEARTTRKRKKRKHSADVAPSQLIDELADFDSSEEVEADLEEKVQREKKQKQKRNKPAAAKRVSKKVARVDN